MIADNGPTLLCAAYQRVLEASTEEWASRVGPGPSLTVQATEDGAYRFSPGGLCFPNRWAFVEAMICGFAWPRLGSLLANPFSSWRAIQSLRGASAAMKGDFGPDVKVAIGLRSGLAAAEVYGREDSQCAEAMSREAPGCVVFAVADASVSAWFSHGDDGFQSGGGEPSQAVDARIIFRDMETALRAVETGLDPLVAPAAGQVKVSGRIPLAEAVGYVADKASRDLILPK